MPSVWPAGVIAVCNGRPLAVACGWFFCFYSSNLGLRTLLRPHAARFLAGGGAGEPQRRLDVFVNHSITMVHALLACVGVGSAIFSEDALGVRPNPEPRPLL
eukprot:SAG11_NODE_1598_length_4610_cov_2.897362_1_plen_102_part_00